MATQEIFDLLNRIQEHADAIYVREGSKNVRLFELPTPLAVEWIFRWIRQTLQPLSCRPMSLQEALEQFDVAGSVATICCGSPVIMDSADGSPKVYCGICGRTIIKLPNGDRWIVTDWGEKGIKLPIRAEE